MITRGTGTLFGLGGQSWTFTGTLKWQDGEYTVKRDKEEIRDENGEAVTYNYYNKTWEGTFTGVLTGTSGSVTVPSYEPGNKFTMTDANDGAAATNWILEEYSPKRNNTTSARVAFKVIRNDNITT